MDDEYITVNGQCYKAMTNEEKRKRLTELDNETIMRWAYIPFVIAEGVWDYADTVIDAAIQLRLSSTKKLSRAVRELRRRYEQKRNAHTFGGNRKGEMKNFMVVEEVSPNLFSYLCDQIRKAVVATYPDLEEDYIYLLVSVYECYYLMQALFKYTKHQSDIICEKCKFDSVRSILPVEMVQLYDIILEFAGDKKVNVVGHGLFTYNLVRKLNMTEFNEVETKK